MSVFIGSVSEEVALGDIVKLEKLGFSIEREKDRLGYDIVGIKFPDKYVYHWFRLSNGWLFFDHSYNQSTGESKKGVKHGLRIKQSVMKSINKAKKIA